jgi:hypothetical protein
MTSTAYVWTILHLGVDLLVLDLVLGDHIPGMVDDAESRRRRALVNGAYILGAHVG